VTTKEQQQSKTERIERAACEGSPTGSHHWVLGSPSATMKGACKYCNAERAFTPFEDEVGFNNSPKKKRAAAATAASASAKTAVPSA
jgi:hypothetical protein